MPYQRGSGFVGLQQYLNANQSKATEMGNAIAGDVENTGNAAQGAITGAGQLFDTKAQAGTPQYDIGVAMMGPTAQRAMADTAAAGGIAYTGPKELSDVADTAALGTQAANAEQQAKLGSTDAGRAVLLNQHYGAGHTTTGGSALDAYLAGRGAGARLDKDATAYGKLQQYLGTTEDAAHARGIQGTTDAATLATRYQNEAPPPSAPAPTTIGTAATSATGNLQRTPYFWERLPGARKKP